LSVAGIAQPAYGLHIAPGAPDVDQRGESSMDQRTTIGASASRERPIHRACVVPGCWCGSTASAGRSVRVGSATTRRASSTLLTNIAWRSVGLPVA
jgi:hypothetical protein